MDFSYIAVVIWLIVVRAMAWLVPGKLKLDGFILWLFKSVAIVGSTTAAMMTMTGVLGMPQWNVLALLSLLGCYTIPQVLVPVKMIIDGIPVNGPIEHSYLFSCSRGLRRDIRYAKEFYCREHNKYCYHVCPICLKYVCRSCMRQTCHNHDILSIQQGINRFLNATLGNLANFVACAAHKQELTLSFDLTKRAIQSVTDRLINAALEENARLLLELDQLKQHILDKNPTSDELAIPDIKGLSSRSNMNEKDMREGLRPEDVKAILTLTIGENTIAADCVHFKQNTEVTGRIGCLVINGRKSDQVRY